MSLTYTGALFVLRGSDGASQSVWVRNFQLGLFSAVLGMAGVIANDWGKVCSA